MVNMGSLIAKSFRVGVDIGGTFTDIVFLGNNGDILTNKILSTPDDFTRAIVKGVEEVFQKTNLSGSDITEVVHGCTVATNTILERSAPPCGLITTKGFRDILEIRRYRIPEMYNLRWEKPPPLAPREFRLEVDERIDSKGGIVCPLNLEQVEAATKFFISKGIKSIAVCLINSYVNPIHEQKIKGVIESKFPEVWVTISSDLLPLMREYERTSEVVINAYIRPVVVDYLSALTGIIRNIGVRAPLLLMRSDGGMMSFETGAEQPVYIIESGPAAGVIGCSYLGKKLDVPNILTLDMGGTTTKASIIEEQQVSRATSYEVGAGISMASRLSAGGGYVIRVSSIDIAEIGAGGGSKLWVDIGGALRIGPVSAGAMPGPACYDLGGEEPTLTDANLVLGYLNPEYLTGGTVKLNAEKAYKALEKVAKRLRWDVTEIAYAGHVIGNSNMMKAIRAVTTERGRDPRDFVLFAYGGAGPIHAATIAHEMEIKKIMITPTPGLFSSFGLLFAEIEHTAAQTFSRHLDEAAMYDANDILDRLKKKVMAEIKAADYGEVEVILEKSVDLKYIGEASETPIAIPWNTLSAEHVPVLAESFHAEHLKTFAHKRETEPIIISSLRARARVPLPEVIPVEGLKPPVMLETKVQSRKAYFGKEYGWLDTSVLGIQDVGDKPQKGPAIIEFYDSTCVIPPYCQFYSGPWGTVHIDVR